MIDEIPAQRLPALKPLLADLAEPDYHIETDLTEEERTLIKDSMKRYHADPSSFVSLDDLKKKPGQVPPSKTRKF